MNMGRHLSEIGSAKTGEGSRDLGGHVTLGYHGLCSGLRTWITLMASLWITLMYTPAYAERVEQCMFEMFNATCRTNQVIMMEHAQYGRMRLGRCVAKQWGHLGCSANVLDLVDSDCSGRRHCVFEVQKLRGQIQPCPKDLMAYIEAKYSCIDVHKVLHSDCNKNIRLNSTRSHIYVSSDVTAQDAQRASSVKCPIMVNALPGQKLNFTLYKFGHQTSTMDTVRTTCPIKVSFTEADGSGRDISLCDLSHREQIVYSSASSVTSVFFHHLATHVHSSHGDGRVLMKVEATGCPDLETPPGAWVQRNGDKAIVKCNHTQETFYVTCSGRTWTGHVTNCTHGVTVKSGGTKAAARTGHIPLGLVVAVTIGVILGVMFGIAMLITVFVYRRRRKASSNSKTTSSLLGGVVGDEASQDNDENYARRVWIEQKHDDPYGRICRGHNAPLQYSSASDYSHMFELQCSARAHAHTLSNEHHIDSAYGSAPRPPGSGHSAADLHGTLPISTLNANSSPSFATFKTERSGLRNSPNKTTSVNARAEGRGFSTFANNRSLSSAAEVDDSTSPDHQPDVVASSNADRPPAAL